jgi:hypothetical protein
MKQHFKRRSKLYKCSNPRRFGIPVKAGFFFSRTGRHRSDERGLALHHPCKRDEALTTIVSVDLWLVSPHPGNCQEVWLLEYVYGLESRIIMRRRVGDYSGFRSSGPILRHIWR